MIFQKKENKEKKSLTMEREKYEIWNRQQFKVFTMVGSTTKPHSPD